MIIPFFIPHSGCPHQCVFCNQKNITGKLTRPDPASVAEMIELFLAARAKKRKLTRSREDSVQVAFYGGTFTALPFDLQRSYLDAVRPFIQSGRIRSIRLSTRPDSVDPEILALLKKRGVETIELGVQSMSDTVLNLSGRGHTEGDSENAVKLLKEYGFAVGLQLMPGLPGDSPDLFRETVRKTIVLDPDFVRIYPAIVVRDTGLKNLFESGQYSPLSLDQAVDLCKEALLRFRAAGIAVIRIGLQPTEELEKPGTIIAGPYHPAFRQLVESSILLDSMKSALEAGNGAGSEVIFSVNPADLANAIGQKRANIEKLKKQFRLTNVLVQPDENISRTKARLVGY